MAKLEKKYDVIIVGAGVAGLNCALNIPEDKSVLLICKDTPEKSDSYLAQGGICRLRGDDDYESYYEDTMRAGHYENDPAAVEAMIRGSREVIDDLVRCGVEFARDKDGSLSYTREGGHSQPRICFHEDCTGKEITSRLMLAVLGRKNVTVAPRRTMLDIICSDNECRGLVIKDNRTRKVHTVAADYVVLACGGIGGVFENSTNFHILTGDGVAICLKRGVAVEHIDYIQIHPTTLYTRKKGRRFLISESVRGEGAVLLDRYFYRFCNELEPRDVVTAAIHKQMKKDGTNFVWLDMRPVPREELLSHFPAIVARCKEEGYDVFTECVPVVPAQHYFMGGIRSGINGETTMKRLYAVGETCCNGVHGKNRLASNSLLESLLFAKRAAEDIANNYSPADKNAFAEAEKSLEKEKYANTEKLFKEYKNILLTAIAAEYSKEEKSE